MEKKKREYTHKNTCIHKPHLFKQEYSINLEMELVICVPSCHVTYRIHA